MPQRASHRQPDAGTKRRRSSDESDSLPDRPRRRKQPVREQHRKAVMQAIEGEIDPVTATTSYQAGLFIVAGAMVMMPLAYIALIGLLGYGIFWHVTSNVALVSFGFWGFVFYGLPLFVGPVVLLFMLKPLFAGQPAHQRIRYLKPEAEPFLYEYVEKLCHSVGAPPPASIRIDTDVNASASFRRGTFSRELTLTIGLPLVHGMTVRQFSGVLAHEFGHFSQSAGMRLSSFIRHINFWFLRAVHERDAWDEWLANWAYNSRRLKPLVFAAGLGVFCARVILWCVMICGRMISFYLTRQMEFDADRHQTRVVGSPCFGVTFRRITALSVAQEIAINDLRNFYDEGRLVDDLPRLIAANVDQITPELKEAIVKHEREQASSVFDTHPSNPDRVASADAEDTPGLMLLPEKLEKLRATILFRDVDRLSRWASLEFYKEILGPDVKPETLFPVNDLIERRDAEHEAAKALHRYFQVRLPYFYPIPISLHANEAPEDPKETARMVKLSRREMLDNLNEYREITERYEHADSALMESSAAVTLLDVGIPIKPHKFGLRRGDWDAASFRNENARVGVETLMGRMLTFETAAGDRLSAAMQLLCDDAFVGAIEDGEELRAEVETFVPEARFVSKMIGELPTMRILCHRMVILFANLRGHEQDPDVIEAIFENMGKLHHRLLQLYKKLGLHRYPFDHADEYMTLCDFALPQIPEENDPGGMLYATQSAMERLVTVQMRLFGRLTVIAERVEKRLGLKPLPVPVEKVKEESS